MKDFWVMTKIQSAEIATKTEKNDLSVFDCRINPKLKISLANGSDQDKTFTAFMPRDFR